MPSAISLPMGAQATLLDLSETSRTTSFACVIREEDMKRRSITYISTLAILLSTLAIPSHATTKGYRYWGYFQAAPSASSWTMAMTGPTTNVKDGSVEGWVHTFSNDTVDAYPPRLAPDFEELCKKVKPLADRKRIGVVVDFGIAAIRPRGETIPRRITTCVQVDLKATGAEVLAAAGKIRAASSGFICGINGYPAKECSAEISTPRSLSK